MPLLPALTVSLFCFFRALRNNCPWIFYFLKYFLIIIFGFILLLNLHDEFCFTHVVV